MASATALTILLGFYAAFCNLDLLEQATAHAQSQSQQSLAASALAPAVLLSFGLTLLLLLVHVRAIAAGGGAGGIFLGRLLAKATVLAAAAALLAGSVLWLSVGEYLGGGADDVGWLYTK